MILFFEKMFSQVPILKKKYYNDFFDDDYFKGGDNKDNVYSLLHPKKFDENVINQQKLIIQYYQVIPKYYLLSSNINVLIYNAKTGSGKSISGVLSFIDLFNNIRIKNFNKNIFKNESILTDTNIGNIYVVSVWSGMGQMIEELLRPEFGFVDEITSKKLQKINSRILEEREEAYTLKNYLVNKLKKIIHFYGYQAFYNFIFNEDKKNIIQDIDNLVNAYKAHTIVISDTVKYRLRNSIIVVDEMQNLYSSDGMNSYGFCIMLIAKLAKELNIKIMLMSGTVFNNSPREIVDVLNIISPQKELYNYDDFVTQYEIIDNVYDYNIKEDKFNELLSLYQNQFIFYNPSININVNPPKIKKISDLDFYVYHDENNQYAMVFDEIPNLPREIHIGSTVISNENNILPFITYQCITYGEQAKEYKKYVSNILQHKQTIKDIEAEDNDEDKNSISIKDAFIPNTDRLKNGIIESSGMFIGKFLSLDRIKEYSTIGYNLTKMVIENAFHKEKTVVYHNKLKNFGIYQYAKILSANGCIGLDEKPKKESLCKNCRNTYEIHELSIDEKIKHRCCNHFIPITYAVLTGDATEQERNYIKQKYNSRLNVYGDIITVIFVSNVAYSGVSFLNTNNIVMISSISNISKWKQIAARIVRTKSHALLSPAKRIAKIYTFVVNYPKEIEVFDKLNKFTLSEQHYAVIVEQNNIIDNFVTKLSEKCIGNMLFNYPEKYKPNDTENKILHNLFMNDVQNNIQNVVNRIFNNDVAKIWSYDVFIKRVMDNNNITYHFDLSSIDPNYLKFIINSLNNVSIFKYIYNNDIINDNNVLDDRYFIELTNDIIEEKHALATFPFSEIAISEADPQTLTKLIENLDTANTYQMRIKILQQIMKYVGKKYSLLANHPTVFNAMYDIHNEHYPDDNINFFKNHHSKERNKIKMDGFYYGDYIIYKDGHEELIDYVYPNDIVHWENIPYLFRITCRAQSNVSLFYLHLIIIEKNDEEVIDGRKLIRGISCTSYKHIDKLLKLFPETKNSIRKLLCNELLQLVIDKQVDNSNIHAVYSPYEK